MHHNGDTIMLVTGYYELDDVMITTEGYSEHEQQLKMIQLALLFHEKLGIGAWLVDDGDNGYHRQLLSDQLAMFARYDTLYTSFKDMADALIPFVAPMAQEMIENYASGRNAGLEFKLTEHGYWAIVPDHDCVTDPDEPCPADPDPKSTYGLTDEQLTALQGGADWSTVKEMA